MYPYPNEKASQSDWVSPPDAPSNYTSRDGAPASSSQDPYPGPPPDYVSATGGNERKQPETVLAPPTDTYSAAGPSTSAAPPQEEHLSLGSFFGSKGNPECWNRQPLAQLPYNAFPPMRLVSNGNELSKGFPELPPPCALNPHPFATHDVTEADWKRFLADVKGAGSLSAGQRIRSNVIPMVTGMSLITGFLVTMAMERRMTFRNRGAAGDLVDHWNHYFFGPRRMEVVLHQASQRVGSVKTEASEDDSSSEDEYRRGFRGDRHAWRMERRARRDMRRDMRRVERAERREWKARGDNMEPYELVITSI